MTAAALLVASAVTNVAGVVTFVRAGLPFYFIQEANGTNWRIERP